MPSSPKKQKAKNAPAKKGKSVKTAYKHPRADEANEAINQANEATVGYTAKVRAIGNSKGVILNNQVLDTAGLKADMDILIQAFNGLITIKQVEKPLVNKDLSTWDKQFKAAIKAGAKPEEDVFSGIENEFDTVEW